MVRILYPELLIALHVQRVLIQLQPVLHVQIVQLDIIQAKVHLHARNVLLEQSRGQDLHLVQHAPLVQFILLVILPLANPVFLTARIALILPLIALHAIQDIFSILLTQSTLHNLVYVNYQPLIFSL